MIAVLVDLCLAGAVAAAWIGCFGAVRMRSALDRIHAVAFTNAACGPLVAVAALLQDGISTRSVKVVGLVAFVLAAGAAVSHVAGRALMLRDGPRA